MNYVRTSTATKGKFKCFQCRSTTAAKDGAWQELNKQQVFLCKVCSASLLKSANDELKANAAKR